MPLLPCPEGPHAPATARPTGRRRTACGRRILSLLSLWTLAPSFVCAQTQPQPATGPATTDLRALQGAARRSSHDLAAAHHASLAATAQLDEAKISPFFQFTAQAGFAWVPDADGTVGYTPNARNQLERDFGPGLQGRIDGAIPLWTFGKLEAARAAARAGIEAAEHDRTRVLQQLRFNIRRAYFGLQLALDTQQMIREGLPKLEQALQRLQDRLAEGDPEVEEASRYRLATALAEVRARKSETDRLEYSTRTALRTLTGLKQVHVPDCPLEPVEYRVQPLERYRRQANRRPELGMVQAAQSARQANLDATVAKYFPDLALALEARADYVPGRTRFEHYTPYYLGAAVVARWSLDLWGQSKRAERARQQLLEALQGPEQANLL